MRRTAISLVAASLLAAGATLVPVDENAPKHPMARGKHRISPHLPIVQDGKVDLHIYLKHSTGDAMSCDADTIST